MKLPLTLAPAALALIVCLGGAAQLRADITVRLSIKFILNSNGANPTGNAPGGAANISTSAGFDTEITKANQVLAAFGRGYRLQVVEYLTTQPAPPAGQAADYWYNLDARNNRAVIEAAALTNQGTWRWNVNALNIYVNNSSSGQCSFVGSGFSISLGGTIFSVGTVVHEVGHFFNLSHTHAGDPSCAGFVPTQPLANYLGDGDGLSATTTDYACFTRDQLSVAHFGSNYVVLLETQQDEVNTSWLNVMSYHQEDQLLEEQMDIWTLNANRARLGFCTGRTWFVAIGGSDTASGDNAGSPFATAAKGVASVGGGDDVVLLRSGTYNSPASTITTPCTLRATRGDVTIGPP